MGRKACISQVQCERLLLELQSACFDYNLKQTVAHNQPNLD